MKRLVLLLLILIILIIPILNHLDKRTDKPDIGEIDIRELDKDIVFTNTYEEGNQESSSGGSTIFVDNIEYVNEYLDLDSMLIYKDLLIEYGIKLPNILLDNLDTNKHYEANEVIINNIFGIYSYGEFEIFYNTFKGNLNKGDILSEVRIDKIEKEGNLLISSVSYIYGDKEVSIDHYINYVFINERPEVFIYHKEG